jgi:hypothetical protein
MLDYNDPSVLEAIQSKPTRDQKFMKNLLWLGEHGCKDFFLLGDIKDYDPSENIVTSNDAILMERMKKNILFNH